MLTLSIETPGGYHSGNAGGGFMKKVSDSMGGGQSSEAKKGAFQNLFSY